MRLAIMQPYFFPYIGYFQLIANVDAFIMYDDVKYTKKGWINRNRMLLDGKDKLFSLPLKKDSDLRNIVERELSEEFNPNKLLNRFQEAYKRAPYCNDVLPLIREILNYQNRNLFKFIYNSNVHICKYLGINTEIIISSKISIDTTLKGEDRVIALCKALRGNNYVNSIGGIDLYNKEKFKAEGIELQFIKPNLFEYSQCSDKFIPSLSIVDVMMFNSVDAIREGIYQNYQLI